MTPDPLYAALLKERYSSTWWVTTRPEEVDSKLTQGIRRNVLRDEYDTPDHEERAAS